MLAGASILVGGGKLAQMFGACNLLTFPPLQNGHKQVLTIYNPLNHALHFKILATKQNVYRVQPASGSLAPQCSTDVVVLKKN
jgi:hypothetical protein